MTKAHKVKIKRPRLKSGKAILKYHHSFWIK